MALPITTLLIRPGENALHVHDLDYEILKRRDLGLAYIQVDADSRFAVTKTGHHRVQVYNDEHILSIASLIVASGWIIQDEVSPHTQL